jgi:signal transduction histidine kinase
VKGGSLSERGLVLAPHGRDATIACGILAQAAIGAIPVASLTELVAVIEAGAGFVVITQEALATADPHDLARWIDSQEPWSDLPFILLTHHGGSIERNPAAARSLNILTNVTFIERPFHPTTLISLAQAALRGRRRQYEARARLKAISEAEARLRELNSTLERRVAEALAERKLFADVVMTTDGSFQVLDHDLRYLAINPSAVADYRRIFGVEPKVGQTMYEVLAHAPDQIEPAVAVWRRALSGESFDETSSWKAPGFSPRWYEMQFRPLHDAEGRQIGAYLFGQDVTERVRDQEKLVETTARLHEGRKLETLGQLTGGVAHDFNNLLTPILGALELLRKRHAEDARSTRLLDGALQAIDRAKTLVQRLLGFAKRQTLETQAIDLVTLVERMRDLIQSSIGAGIELRIAAPDGPAYARVDPNQLELAVLNLCVNARDAMPNGGVLTLAVEKHSATPWNSNGLAPGDYQRLSVIDTGSGMDDETLRRAVEPFYSTKDVGKGTGLGLSLVHGLAAQLGGAFALSSVPRQGTRADLYLPVAPAEEAVDSAPPTAAAAAIARPLTVLVVDDEPLVRIGTAEMLRDAGHRVIEAGGGAEALERLRGNPDIDAVVTDYTMPRMSGAELARQIAEIRATLPVLMITGYARSHLGTQLSTLAKPFGQADLIDALRQVVDPQQASA